MQVPAGDRKAGNNLLATQEKCEALKTEICETLRLLDKERRCDDAQERNPPYESSSRWLGFVSSERR